MSKHTTLPAKYNSFNNVCIGHRNKHAKRKVPSSTRTEGRRNRFIRRHMTVAHVVQELSEVMQTMIVEVPTKCELFYNEANGIASIKRFDSAGRSYDVNEGTPMWNKCQKAFDEHYKKA